MGGVPPLLLLLRGGHVAEELAELLHGRLGGDVVGVIVIISGRLDVVPLQIGLGGVGGARVTAPAGAVIIVEDGRCSPLLRSLGCLGLLLRCGLLRLRRHRLEEGLLEDAVVGVVAIEVIAIVGCRRGVVAHGRSAGSRPGGGREVVEGGHYAAVVVVGVVLRGRSDQ